MNAYLKKRIILLKKPDANSTITADTGTPPRESDPNSAVETHRFLVLHKHKKGLASRGGSVIVFVPITKRDKKRKVLAI